MRDLKTSVGENYHVFNSGNNSQLIFLDERDRIRFLFLILYLQSPTPVNHITSYIDYFKKNSRFNVSGKITAKLKENSLVQIINFSIMPSYFHLTLTEKTKGGISRYMHKILVSYAKYFNTRYRKSGHLFQGTFHLSHIKTEEELLHLSAYIHKSPRELHEWRNRAHLYPWSSYQDYYGDNRFVQFLSTKTIKDKFKTPEDYKSFVDESKAQDVESFTEKLPISK